MTESDQFFLNLDTGWGSLRILEPIAQIDEFSMGRKGLSLIEGEDFIDIYTDPFRSVPLYIHSGHRVITVFREYPSFLQIASDGSFVPEIDKAGFFETVLYGAPLWTRTIYRDLKQLPAASRLRIDKASGNLSFSRYWNFCIGEDPSIRDIGVAGEGLNHHLKRIFDSLDFAEEFCMGLSGGMDSRLTLSYLSERIPREQLDLFTFGFDSRILEYRFAQEISHELSSGEVAFHTLEPSHYVEALDYLPLQSLGQVAINHCHITSYLRKANIAQGWHISNFYSDAIFGYATHAPKTVLPVGTDGYSTKLGNCTFIEDDIKEEIRADISKILEGFDADANYSSQNEYIYITERHPKFHFNLAHCQSQIVPTITPYADLDLLRFMISVPLKHREQKVMLDQLFEMYFPCVASSNVGQISSRLSRRFSSGFNWVLYRGLNLSNGILRVLTDGKLQILNKFQTEEHERLLFTEFRTSLQCATRLFVSLGLLSSSAKGDLDKLPLRAVGADYRYTLISLARLVETTSDLAC